MSLCQANSQFFTASNGTWRQVQFFSTVSTSPGGKFGQKSPPKSPLLVERNHILIQTTQFILQCNALRAFAVSYLDNQYRSQYNPDSFALISVYAVMHLRIEDSRPIVRTLSPGGGHGTKAAHANPWSASSSFFIEIKTTNHCYTTTNTNTTATTTKKSRHIQHSTTTKTVPSSQCNNMQYHAARPSIFHWCNYYILHISSLHLSSFCAKRTFAVKDPFPWGSELANRPPKPNPIWGRVRP